MEFKLLFVFVAELSQQHSEENMEKSLTVNKKPAVILKKELAQKTDALNSALKRENQLKVCECVSVCDNYNPMFVEYHFFRQNVLIISVFMGCRCLLLSFSPLCQSWKAD